MVAGHAHVSRFASLPPVSVARVRFESVVQTWEKKKTQAERQVEELNRQVEVARNKQSVVLQRQVRMVEGVPW